MKKIYLLFIASLILFVATAQKAIVNDENAETRTLSGSFNAIKISGGIDLFLSQYATESMAVSASEQKYKEGIKTVIENNTLKIYYEGDKKWGDNKKMKVYVAFKNLHHLQASGACDVQVAGTINANTLTLEMSGASGFKGDVKVDGLNIILSGASDIKISGTANNTTIETSGASDVKGYDLTTETCIAKASGASDVNITVSKTLSGTASGASDIYYKGSGVISNQHAGGASTIGKKE